MKWYLNLYSLANVTQNITQTFYTRYRFAPSHNDGCEQCCAPIFFSFFHFSERYSALLLLLVLLLFFFFHFNFCHCSAALGCINSQVQEWHQKKSESVNKPHTHTRTPTHFGKRARRLCSGKCVHEEYIGAERKMTHGREYEREGEGGR